MSKRIIIHKPDSEGAFHIDAMTGAVVTPQNELPDWAEGLASALLAERVGFYEKRLGTNLPEQLRKPNSMAMEDLGWIGVDQEGDEVEIEAVTEYRSEMLGKLLEIDLDNEDLDGQLGGDTLSVLTDYTYETHPTDEKTLLEASDQSFEQNRSEAHGG